MNDFLLKNSKENVLFLETIILEQQRFYQSFSFSRFLYIFHFISGICVNINGDGLYPIFVFFLRYQGYLIFTVVQNEIL